MRLQCVLHKVVKGEVDITRKIIFSTSTYYLLSFSKTFMHNSIMVKWDSNVDIETSGNVGNRLSSAH